MDSKECEIEIENNSEEFEHFHIVIDAVENSISQNEFYSETIEYENYTEKGKESIKKHIEWFKTNTSKTPIQDAFIKLLIKNGIYVDWIPFDKWCELPVMKPIDYSSKEELKEKRRIADEKFKNSLSEENKAYLRDIANKMK